MPTSLQNPEIACHKCGQAVVLEGVPTNEREPNQSQTDWIAEQWDNVAPELVKLGWQVRRHEVWVVVKNEVGTIVDEQKQRMRRHALCPTCAVQTPVAAAPLPAFSSRPKCVMCGNRAAAVKFCDGRSGRCRVGARDHVHRTCGKCGFQWAEAPRHERATAVEAGHFHPQTRGRDEQDRGPAAGVEAVQAAPAAFGGEVGQG